MLRASSSVVPNFDPTSPTMHHSIILTALCFFVFMSASGQEADAGPDTSLCMNYYTMQGNPLPPGATGYWVIYSGCATINNPTLANTQVENLCVGVSVFGWAVDDGVTITTDQITITVYDANMANADAGPDTITVIAPQTSAFLSGSPTPIYPASCWWNWVQGSGVVTDANDPNSTVTGLVVGDNILAWTCDNGPCGSFTDTVVVQLMMPTGIGPGAAIAALFAWDQGNRQLVLVGRDPVKEVMIVDMQGRVAHLEERIGNGRSWSLSGLWAGAYLVRAQVNGQPLVQRLVILD